AARRIQRRRHGQDCRRKLHADLRRLGRIRVSAARHRALVRHGLDPYLWYRRRRMKTTIELPDELFVAAKKRAAELRCSLKSLIERGLRNELRQSRAPRPRRRKIRWVTVRGGLAPGLDVADRESMYR